MNELEIKRTEVEYMRVQAARGELELKILEREQDIARIKEHIAIQIAKEEELKLKIKQIRG